MKKPYQIEAQRAVKQLEAMATDGNPAVQMILPHCCPAKIFLITRTVVESV